MSLVGLERTLSGPDQKLTTEVTENTENIRGFLPCLILREPRVLRGE